MLCCVILGKITSNKKHVFNFVVFKIWEFTRGFSLLSNYNLYTYVYKTWLALDVDGKTRVKYPTHKAYARLPTWTLRFSNRRWEITSSRGAAQRYLIKNLIITPMGGRKERDNLIVKFYDIGSVGEVDPCSRSDVKFPKHGILFLIIDCGKSGH